MAARSLGVLTLDLIAKIGGYVGPLDQASRITQKRMKEIEKFGKDLGKAVSVAVGATASAVAAFTVLTARNATETARLASVSGVAADEFQRYAAGSKILGIEQDKLSDIFKDTNDKIGDFMQTGAGPLADFFENIAPKVGVTADQFRKLSGPQALELYVASLEKAGASQNELTFYMEAIASDATLLLPLLKNNAEGFRLLGDEAGRLGLVLSDETIADAERLEAALWLLNGAADGIKRQIGSELLPVIADMAELFSETAVQTGVASDVGQTFANLLKLIAVVATGAYAAVQLLGRSIAGLGATLSAATDGFDIQSLSSPTQFARSLVQNFNSVEATVEVAADDLEDTVARYAEVLDGLWSLGERGNETGAESTVDRIAKLLANRREFSPGGGSGVDRELIEAQKAIDATIKSLELQAMQLGMTASEASLYKLQIDGATEAQLDNARAALELIDAYKENTAFIEFARAIDNTVKASQRAVDAQVAAIGMGQRRAEIAQQIIDIETEYADKLVELAAAQGTANALTEDAYRKRVEIIEQAMADEIAIVQDGYRRKAEAEADGNNGIIRATQDYIDSAADLATQFEDVATSIFQGLEDSIVQFVQTGKLSFSDLANSIIADIIRIETRQAIAGFAQSFTSDVGFWASLFGGGRANGGPVQSSSIYEVGEFNRPELFMSGGKQYLIPGNDGRVTPAGGSAGVTIGQMVFPGITNAREAELAAGAAGRRISRIIAGSQRYN